MKNSRIRTHAATILLAVAAFVSGVGADPAPADSAAYWYNQGNAAYRDGRFADAVRAYRRAAETGIENAALHANLGNAYFRLGRIGPAILHYERSLRLEPLNDDARHNLEFASLLIADRVEDETLEVRVRETVRGTIGSIADKWLAIGLAMGLTGLCLVGAWWLLGGKRGGVTVSAFVLASMLFVGSAGTVGIERWASDSGRAAIALASRIEVRFEPTDSAKVAFIVHEGTKVWVERREGAWLLVSTANGLRGWISGDSVEII